MYLQCKSSSVRNVRYSHVSFYLLVAALLPQIYMQRLNFRGSGVICGDRNGLWDTVQSAHAENKFLGYSTLDFDHFRGCNLHNACRERP